MSAAKEAVLSLDIGGSAIKSGLVLPDGTFAGQPERSEIDSSAGKEALLEDFASVVRRRLAGARGLNVLGIGAAAPGPFDYRRGIPLMKGLSKFDALYGVDLQLELGRLLPETTHFPWRWINDASAFALGELRFGAAREVHRAMFLTLGTGCGSAFAVAGELTAEGVGVPPDGYVYPLPFNGTIIDELLSQRGIMRLWREECGQAEEPAPAFTAAQVAGRASAGDDVAGRVFRRFGELLALSLKPVFESFRPDLVILGGQIARSYELFAPAAKAAGAPPLAPAQELEAAALKGAASLILEDDSRR